MNVPATDRPWTDHEIEPRTFFPPGTPASVRRRELAVAVEVACARCDAARAALPMRRIVGGAQ